MNLYALPKVGCLFAKLLCLFVSITSFESLSAQLMEKNGFDGSALNRSFLPSSPLAAGFATYGQNQVNLFTGTPVVDIPLYNLSYKELSVNLGLSYQNGNGVKPGSFPGPVGNGWLLASGGVITRISKGIIPAAFPDPQTVQAGFNYTSYSDWSSNARMQTNISTPVYLTSQSCQYDEYSYNFLGLSGKFYTDYNGKKKYKTAQGEDLLIEIEIPDTKNFTFPVESQQPPDTRTGQGTYNNTVTIRQSPYKFTVTDSKGIIYTFGGTDASIEFSRVGRSNFSSTGEKTDDREGLNTEPISWYLTSIKSPNGYEITFTYQRDKFYVNMNSYVKGLHTSFVSDNGVMNFSNIAPTARLIRSNLINPVYLQTITTPNATIQFNWSIADQQLGYKYNADISYPVTNTSVQFEPSWQPDKIYCDIDYFSYADVLRASIVNRFPKKLDYFTVSNSTGIVKTVNFSYTNDVNTRLKLTSVKLKGKTDDNASIYQFSYNTVALPDYLTFMTDTYGYYNGQNTHITSNSPSDYYNNFQNATWRSNYLSSRAVNLAYAKAEILEKVTYPTGGYTLFEYESNDYGKVVQPWQTPATVDNANNSTLITGGLRISKISHYDYGTHKAGEKKYFYKKNYATGGIQSSGVLNYIPRFHESFNGHIERSNYYAIRGNTQAWVGTMNYLQYSTDPINAMSVNKNSHITYSEVSEVNEDGSYTVYKFKNYDNGYEDRPAVNAIYDHKTVSDLWKEDDANSLELERGQVLSEGLYSNNNVLKLETIYEYNDDPNRFNDNGTNVRMLKCIPNPIMSPQYGISIRYIATLAYTYYPFLKKKIQKEYPLVGPPIETYTKYQYDNTYRIVKEEKHFLSDGTEEQIEYKYPSDMVLAGITVPYQQMVSKRMVSSLVETIANRNNNLLKGAKTNYYFWGANGWTSSASGSLILPQSQETKNRVNSNYQKRINFISYDNIGSITTQNKEDDFKESYIWGYNKAYPVAEVKNASANEIYFADFEKNGWDVPTAWPLSAYDENRVHTGRYSGRIDNDGPGEKVVHADQWLNISLSQATKFKYSGWVYSTGPSAEIFFFMKTATEQNYFTYVTSIVTSQTNKWVYIEGEYTVPSNITKLNIRLDNNGAGTVWFDDIRLHPSAALMKTYTYDPLIGMTSATDINNRSTYYVYDGQGRLALEKDNDGNVLRKYCYNYAGQPENCTFTTAPLWQSTGNYRCITDANGTNNGYQEREEIDNNPNSTTYQQLRWVLNGFNTTACPLAPSCDYYNCNAQGEGRSCINGQCEYGYRVYTGSYYDWSSGMYICTYHYEFSNGSWSQDYTEYSYYSCY